MNKRTQRVMVLMFCLPLTIFFSCATIPDVNSTNPKNIYVLISKKDTKPETISKYLENNKEIPPIDFFYLVKRSLLACNGEVIKLLLNRAPTNFFESRLRLQNWEEDKVYRPDRRITIARPSTILLRYSFEVGCSDGVELLVSKVDSEVLHCAINKYTSSNDCWCPMGEGLDGEEDNQCEGLSKSFYNNVNTNKDAYKKIFDLTVEKISKLEGDNSPDVQMLKISLDDLIPEHKAVRDVLSTACTYYDCISNCNGDKGGWTTIFNVYNQKYKEKTGNDIRPNEQCLGVNDANRWPVCIQICPFLSTKY